jgi:hypothetical protein
MYNFINETNQFNINSFLPTLCISLYGNNLIFTTKKIGSRFFEHISNDANGIDVNQEKYINVELSLVKPINSESIHTFNEFNLNIKYESGYTIDDFLNLIEVKNFKDIFTKSFTEKYNIIFVTRNPIKRLLTGFIEVVDSMFSRYNNDLFFKYLVERHYSIYFNHSDTPSIRNLIPLDKSNKILNEYVELFDNSFFEDEHISYWNTFVYNTTKSTPIYDKITFLDLDNPNDMMQFGEFIDGESNTSIINNWIHFNESSVSKLLNKSKVYLSMESYFYKKLLKI